MVNLTEYSVSVYIKLYSDRIREEAIISKHKNKWIEKINKKYNPKVNLHLCFYSEEVILSDGLRIETILQVEAINFYGSEKKLSG